MPNPRKPTEMKKIEGTFRKDRANPNEPQIEVAIPYCPSDLSPKAKAVWKRVIPLLHDARIITLLHRDTLAEYCDLVAQSADLRSDIKVVRKALKKLNPKEKNYTKLLLDLKKEIRAIHREKLQVSDSIRKYATEFAMTAACQSKVSAIPKKEKKAGKGKSRFFTVVPIKNQKRK